MNLPSATGPSGPRTASYVFALSVLVALLAPGSEGAGQETVLPDDPLAGFDAYVSRAMDAWEVPGLAVAVVKDGRLAFSRGYGLRELGTGAPVDSETLFAVGSTTKAITAAAVGMLVDEGALGWDDRVVEHLPWFRLHDPWVTREVRVRDLLTHRAGLGNADFLWYEQDAGTREIVERLRHVEPAYSLRAGFVYQNIMYAAAGELVEAVSGTGWEAFVRTRVFEPLGMDRSVTSLVEAERSSNVATPHDEVDGTLVAIENASVDPVAAAGSIWSSVEDMSSWLAFLLRGCQTQEGEALLEPATCEELFAPQQIVRDGFYPTTRLTRPHWTTYGLGWFQHDYEGRKVDFHTGSIDGMVAIAGLIREEGIGVYVLGNRDHAELRHALMYRVFDLYDDEAPRDWSAELSDLYGELAARQDSIAQAGRAERVTGTEPSLPLERYAGAYVDPLYGTVTIARDDDGLRATYGRLTGVLEHWHYDTFRVSWDARWRGTLLLSFVLDADGSVSRIEAGESVFHRVDRRREGGPDP